MTRVLHVFGALNRGGAESRTMDIYRKINRSKIQFDFMVHTEEEGIFEGEIRSLGGKIYRVPSYKIYNRLPYRRAWQHFLNEHPEISIVHIHTTNMAGEILPLLARRKIPVRISHSRCASNPDWPRHIVSRLSRRKINALSTHRFAVSTEAGRYVFGSEELETVRILPGSIDAEAFQYNESTRFTMRRKLALEGKYAIGHVGRFSAEKNHAFLLSAFGTYAQSCSDAVLLLIGDGPLRGDMEKRIGEMGLEDRVFFLGLRQDVSEIMQALDLLALPSLYEGLPGVIIEGQAAGLPCLVSDTVSRECAILPDYVEFLPTDQGTASWCSAFDRMRGFPRKNTTEAIKKAGFDANTQVHLYEKLYEELHKSAEMEEKNHRRHK